MKFNKSKKFFAGLMASLFVSGIGFNAKAIGTVEEVHELAATTINAKRDLLDVLDPDNTLRLNGNDAISREQACLLLNTHRRQLMPAYTPERKTRFAMKLMSTARQEAKSHGYQGQVSDLEMICVFHALRGLAEAGQLPMGDLPNILNRPNITLFNRQLRDFEPNWWNRLESDDCVVLLGLGLGISIKTACTLL